jgi:hypothetical protein
LLTFPPGSSSEKFPVNNLHWRTNVGCCESDAIDPSRPSGREPEFKLRGQNAMLARLLPVQTL